MSHEEQQELIRLIGEISLAWSALEEDLTFLLSAILANKEQRVVAAIFHASTSIDVKLTMIDESFKIIASALPNTQIVSRAWKRLRRRMEKQKATRNAATHGSFINAYGTLCLAPPSFSAKFWRQATQKTERLGVSAHEIQQAIDSIQEIRNGVMHVANLIWFWREGELQAYAQRLQELSDSSTTNVSGGSRNP